MSASPPSPSGRRAFLQLLGQSLAAGSSVWASPMAWAQSGGNPDSQQSGNARLILVFLRGAYDGLSALVPHGDRDYYRLRSNIAIPAPDGSLQSAIALGPHFGLHPALAPLQALCQQGVLAALPCAGSPDATRSHFDAQHHWETGRPGFSGSATGWLNALATQTHGGAIGVGEANPQILAGSAPVQLVPRGQAATRQGALGNARARDAVLQLYAGQDDLAQAFRSGAKSRRETAQTLSQADQAEQAANPLEMKEMQAANNGAGAVQGLALDARHLGTLMHQNPRLRLGFLSAGGWDTHANQGGISGTLASNLGHLAQALVQLRRDFSQPDDVVVVCSEFGRTCAENGTRGTDHGHGNALWLLGNRVQGGRVHGQWSGLAAGNLHEGRDLPVHHDFRAVLAQVLRATQGLSASQTDALFPGFVWDAELNGLMRS